MKPFITRLLLLVPLASVNAETSDTDIEGFIQGKYYLIGQRPDSNSSYQGTLRISSFASGMSVSRIIANDEVIGTASIERVTADKVPTLQIRFKEGSREYQQSCLIGSDLDNYARITCQTVATDGSTRRPGLEAFFVRR